MLGTKIADRIAIAAIAAALAVCLLLSVFSGTVFAGADGGVSMQYESRLFDHDSIMTVDILMDEDDWQDMLDNAAAEEYSKCDAVVNGTTFYSVAIRPKGNTSLSSIVNDPTTDRYSFKLEFDHYIDGQTCFGLDKLILNNNYADATNMKEAIAYDMFAYLGADCSLYNYAKISVNGEYWGVYLALEAVEDSFIMRNYGTESGALYKPDSMQMGGGGKDDKKQDNAEMPDFGDFTPPEQTDGDNGFGNFTPPEKSQNGGDSTENTDQRDDTKHNRGDMPGGGFGGFGSSGGSNLNYTDDELDSYSDIWDGGVSSTSKSDHKRVVEALKAAADGTELEKYLDIDNLLKYMAAHEFVVNLDSLSGNMAHNYYLYESGGKLNIIPWDYNLSFGGMNGTSSTAVNDAIDTPFSGTQFFDAILENEEYLAKYHEYLRILCDEYVVGGVFQQTYDRIRSQIDELVDTDPNAFYTYDEYNAAAEMLVQVVQLRAESVSDQLDGTIPSTDSAQTSSDALIDTSGIDISIMGGMGGGGARNENAAPGNKNDDFGGFPGNPPDGMQKPQDGENQTPPELPGASADGSTSVSQDGSPDTRPQDDGTLSGTEPPANAIIDGTESTQQTSEEQFTSEAEAAANDRSNFRPGGFGGNGQQNFPGSNTDTASTGNSDGIVTLLVSAGVIAAGLVFAALFRANRR